MNSPDEIVMMGTQRPVAYEPEVRTRRIVSPLERTSEIETLFNLTSLLVRELAGKNAAELGFPDSQATLDTLILWSNQFNEIHAWANWDEEDYLESMHDWFYAKFRQRGAEPPPSMERATVFLSSSEDCSLFEDGDCCELKDCSDCEGGCRCEDCSDCEGCCRCEE